jgi:hypothetical protein
LAQLVSEPAGQRVSEKAARDKAASDKAVSEEAARDETASDKAVSEETARDEAARDETASEETARDEAARDETASGQRPGGSRQPCRNGWALRFRCWPGLAVLADAFGIASQQVSRAEME